MASAIGGTRAQHEAQEEEILAQVRSRPPIGSREHGLSGLEEELKANEGFSRKIPGMISKYSGLRRVRGDGNCFFRAFMFRYFEVLLSDRTERERALEVVKSSLEYLLIAGYESVSIESFVEFTEDMLENLEKMSLADLEEVFSDEGESDYLVWFARLVSAGFLKSNADRFVPFLPFDFVTVQDFCAKEVEPMGKECEQLQIIALSEYLGVRVQIEYLDSGDSATTSTHTFGPEESSDDISICLLYRPSHYDILYL